MKISEILSERQIRKTDPEMDEYYDDRGAKDENVRQGPYAVRWEGQGYEWYGNGDPSDGEGRYKNKYAGEILAINVPTHQQAKELADKLDAAYQNQTFYDDSVYGKMGEDHWLSDYYGAEAVPMKDIEEWELKHARSNPRVKDFERAV